MFPFPQQGWPTYTGLFSLLWGILRAQGEMLLPKSLLPQAPHRVMSGVCKGGWPLMEEELGESKAAKPRQTRRPLKTHREKTEEADPRSSQEPHTDANAWN